MRSCPAVAKLQDRFAIFFLPAGEGQDPFFSTSPQRAIWEGGAFGIIPRRTWRRPTLTGRRREGNSLDQGKSLPLTRWFCFL